MLKKNSGVSLITLIITIIVVIILAVIVMIGTGGTIEQANYSAYMDDLGKVKEAVKTKAMEVKGQYLIDGRTVSMEEIYHYVAKGGKTGEDFVGKANVPAYTIIDRAKADIGIEIPTRNIESGTARNVQIQYIVTKEGEVFAWPPYEYEDKLYITENIIVAGKLDKNIQIEDESFTLDLDETLGTVIPGGESIPGGNTPGGENPDGNNPGGENPDGNNPGGETPEGNYVYDDTFPLEVNSVEILNSDNFNAEGIYKVSNLTPDASTMVASVLNVTATMDDNDDGISETIYASDARVVAMQNQDSAIIYLYIVTFDVVGELEYPLIVVYEEMTYEGITAEPGIYAMVYDDVETNATLSIRETRYDDTFPIEFNSTEIVNSGNYRQGFDIETCYKVSNLIPDEAAMRVSSISMELDGETIEYPVANEINESSYSIYWYGTMTDSGTMDDGAAVAIFYNTTSIPLDGGISYIFEPGMYVLSPHDWSTDSINFTINATYTQPENPEAGISNIQLLDYVTYESDLGDIECVVVDKKSNGNILLMPTAGVGSLIVGNEGDGTPQSVADYVSMYYNDLEDIINAKCKEYTSTKLGVSAGSIRSATAEDTCEFIGHNPDDNVQDKSAFYLYSDNFTYGETTTADGLAGYEKRPATSVFYNGITIPRFYEYDYAKNTALDENGRRYAYPTETDPVFVTSSYIHAPLGDLLNSIFTSEAAFLASKSTQNSTDTSILCLDVIFYGYLTNASMYESNGDINVTGDGSVGVIPLFELSSTLNLDSSVVGMDGSKANPWKLTK